MSKKNIAQDLEKHIKEKAAELIYLEIERLDKETPFDTKFVVAKHVIIQKIDQELETLKGIRNTHLNENREKEATLAAYDIMILSETKRAVSNAVLEKKMISTAEDFQLF